MQRSFVNNRIAFSSKEFRVVRDEVFQCSNGACALNTFHKSFNKSGSEERIFTEIFEVAPALGDTVTIHSRPEQYPDASTATFFTDSSCIGICQSCIPGGGQC